MLSSFLLSEYSILILLMILTAIPVGFFAGLFGIGGGLISVPFLFFVFETLNFDKEYLMHLSVGTSFLIIIPTALVSVLTHKKNNGVDFTVLKTFGIFVIIGVISGTIIAAMLKTKFLILLFSIIVYSFGAYLLLVNLEIKKIKNFSFFHRVILGFFSGLISAPIGITGAMMNVPILRYFGYPINLAIGSAAAIGFVIATFGAIGFLISGYYLDANLPLSVGFVNIPAFLIFIPVTTFMARIGANKVHNMNKKKLQKMFGIFLYVVGTIFLIRFFNI